MVRFESVTGCGRRWGMEVLVRDNQIIRKVDPTAVEEVMLGLMRELGCNEDAELSVLFTNDDEMQLLNSGYRGVNEPTDVLSFPMMGAGPVDMLGDIVISVPTTVRQAKEYEVTEDQRLCRLLIHGLLHLLGFDHEGDEEDAKKMFAKEEDLMQKYGHRILFQKGIA